MKINPEGLEEIVLKAAENLRQDSQEKQIVATPHAVVEEAKKTEKAVERGSRQVTKNIKDLSRIEEILNSKMETFVMPPPPAFSEIESHEEFKAIVADVLEIVGRYRRGEIDPALYNDDVMMLSGLLVYLAGKLSMFQNIANDREAMTELAEAKYYIEAKRAAQVEDISLSDETAKKMAKNYTMAMVIESSNYQMIQRYLFNIYLSTKSFVELLDSTARREFSVNLRSPQ